MIPRVLAAMCCVLLPAGAVHGQTALFSSNVEAVRVDVLVADNGKPVLGLGPSDFEVLDNGVAQQVDLVSFDQIPLNVILAFDVSDSVAGGRLDELREAAGALLPALKGDDQTALITFSQVVGLDAKLEKDRGPLRAALRDAKTMQQTALVDATYAGIMVGESDVGRSLLMVFSDGLDTSSWLRPNAVVDIARQSDVVVYAVAARSPHQPDFLRDVTSATGGRLLEVERTAHLGSVLLNVVDEFRHRYLVSYTPRGVPRDGWHRLDVRVRRKGSVRARPGYLAGPRASDSRAR